MIKGYKVYISEIRRQKIERKQDLREIDRE